MEIGRKINRIVYSYTSLYPGCIIPTMKQAMILAAGLGTRLRPLTLVRPKPLVPIINRPLLGILIEQLEKIGITRLAVNTHHLSDRIADFILKKGPKNFDIKIFYEPCILGTGGGIKNTASFWRRDPVLVINGDILTDIDLDDVVQYHQSHDCPVTLVVHNYERFNQVPVNENNEIVGFTRREADAEAAHAILAFTGIQVIDYRVFREFPTGAGHSIDTYERMLKNREKIKAYRARNHSWFDVGSIRDYMRLHRDLLLGKIDFRRDLGIPSGPVSCEPGVYKGSEARLEGWVSLGKNVRIGGNALIANSILWDNVKVEKGAIIMNSIVGDDVRVTGRLIHGIQIDNEGVCGSTRENS